MATQAERREKTQTAIVKAAKRIFGERGFAVATMDDIAAGARVAKGAVYHHFPTKEALFEAVVAARVEDLAADARRRSQAADPGAAFFGFLARVGEEARVKRDLPDAIAVPGPLQDALHEAIGALLSRAQQAGAVRGDVTTGELIVLFKAAAAAFRDTSATPATRDQVFAVITDGLRPRPPRR